MKQSSAISQDRLIRRLWRESGAELFEAALVLPIFLTLVMGCFWMSRAYNIYQTITRAAREGARFAAAPSCATCGNAFPTSAEIRAVVNGALSAVALDPAQVTNAAPCSTGPGCDCPAGQVCIQTDQPLDPTDPSANQVPGVIVSFGYPFQFVIPFTKLSVTKITISTQVQMRQEF
jgi:TadE-like protein